MYVHLCVCFFFQAEDGIRDAQESRGLGDVYKRQMLNETPSLLTAVLLPEMKTSKPIAVRLLITLSMTCLLYTSDAADDLLCVDLGGRRIIKKKKNTSINISYQPQRTCKLYRS